MMALLAFFHVLEANRDRLAFSSGSPSPTPRVEPVWSTRITRPLSVEVAGKFVAIPEGAQVRVVARTGSEVMISFQGESLVVPAAATELK